MPVTEHPRLVAVVGPTATGKSGLGLDLAEHLGGEIIGADAMALYRGMDIGTAKTPPDRRRGITHHQIDVLDVTQEASVAAYQRHGRAAIEAVWAKGKTAIVVGGSGLYIRALLDQIEFPGTDPALRAKWETLAAERGADWLHQELTKQDPAAATVIEAGNARRLVRALEVIELTGQPFKAQLPNPQAWQPVRYVGLDMDNDLLDQCIAQRVDQMWQDGLLAEVTHLERLGLRQGKTAARAIGYQECLKVLDGQLSQAEAKAGIAQATRQLARRQRKWFRRDSRITWIDAQRVTVAQVVAVLANSG